MGKFPQIVEGFLEGKDRAIDFINRRKLPLAVFVSLILSIAYFVYSQPVFYAQAYKVISDEKDAELVMLANLGIFEGAVGRKNNYISSFQLGKSISIFPAKENEFEKELYAMVGDYPIKEMVPYIAKKDKTVAAFIVGIAKKESNWGKRVPTLNGQDCYNYWGYKGAGENGIAMGHGCFATPEEAVNVIGKRLEQLVGKNLTTPSKMVVWKCGSSCAATGGQAAANKWISDVSIYFDKIVKKEA